MRVVVTAVTAGDEVGRQVCEDRDAPSVTNQLVGNALALHRHGTTSVLEDFDEITVVVKPYRQQAPNLMDMIEVAPAPRKRTVAEPLADPQP